MPSKLNPPLSTQPQRGDSVCRMVREDFSLTAASLSHTAAAHRQNVPSNINNAEALEVKERGLK